MSTSVARRWWWLPLAVLAVLALIAWLLAGLVQDRARSLAVEAAGIEPDRVEIVDGLDVRLTGFTDPAELDRAVAAVDALDSSWTVTGVLADGVAPSSSSPSPTSTTAAVSARPTVIELRFDGDTITVAGAVPTEEVQESVVAGVTDAFEAATIDDRLTVDDGAAAPGGTLAVVGTPASPDQGAQWLAGAGSVASAAGLELVDELAVASVEQQLNALFQLEPIEFDAARATIRDASIPTLDEAAALITANPEAGRLRIVGHTDSDGSVATNQGLSERRAQAVLDHLVERGGVDPARLDAVGRGESELAIDPETSPEDKQRNRRIEWELIVS